VAIVLTSFAGVDAIRSAPIPADPPSEDVLDPPTEGELVYGWPDTNRNQPGVYSWDGLYCGSPRGEYCTMGFMHNGYGSGDVEIRIEIVPQTDSLDGGSSAVTVAGHDASYRRIDGLREEWIVDIAETRIRIRLSARPGTSQADLADAHEIIASMRAESQDSDLGFRLLFTLTNSEWDSG
jgi:hypothetical protein